MELITERGQIRTVAKRWRKQYGEGTYGADKRNRNIVGELDALDVETATSADVAEIIGNNSWVCVESCDECGKETWDCVQLGESPDYESRTVYVCGDCLRAALELLNNKG